MSDSGNWCTIESDPAVFTELIGSFGVKDVQVEELYDLSAEGFERLKPIYGLIFLFKWKGEKPKADQVVDATQVPGLFFANQVINNACATQAIISVLLNREEVNLGPTLTEFKKFASNLPPKMRGLALSNSQEIRAAHNSFSRPEPFQIEHVKTGEDEDAFHFVAYIPWGGALWEIDGLQEGPIRHQEATAENWLTVASPIIQARMARYQTEGKGEIRFNLLAILKNIKETCTEKIDLEMGRKLDFESYLVDADGDNGMDVDGQNLTPAQLRAKVAGCEAEIARLKATVVSEEEKMKRWKLDNKQRRHNYIPFIFNLLTALAKKKQLAPLIEKAEEKKKKRDAEKAEKEKAEKEKAEKDKADKPKDDKAVK